MYQHYFLLNRLQSTEDASTQWQMKIKGGRNGCCNSGMAFETKRRVNRCDHKFIGCVWTKEVKSHTLFALMHCLAYSFYRSLYVCHSFEVEFWFVDKINSHPLVASKAIQFIGSGMVSVTDPGNIRVFIRLKMVCRIQFKCKILSIFRLHIHVLNSFTFFASVYPLHVCALF